MAEEPELTAWMKSGKYLPQPLRDFHAAKEVFKCIDEMRVGPNRVDVDWPDAHVYTVDYFLWFMAKRGWTLQRSRRRVPFLDLRSTLDAWRQRESVRFDEMLIRRRSKGEADS